MKNIKDTKKGTKERILKTAEQIFASKGFDGSRVDEIAQKAGVNKALIYYYFKSKEDILEELMNNFLEEALKKKEELFKKRNDMSDKEFWESSANNIMDLFRGKENILRIIITEELKSKKKQWPLFQLLDRGVDDGLERAKKMDFSIKNRDQLIRTAFFFGFIPVAFFLLLKDEWSCFYGTDKEKDEKEFIEIFKKIYVRIIQEEYVK
jgi:AcrR family transcriptional regulator